MTDAPNTLIEKQQAWYKAVAGVFARVQKKDVADIPLDIWQKLIKTTYDGIPINPLYNRADELEEAALPGVFPYLRGAAGVGQENQGWGVAESFDEKSTNQQVLDSLYNGTTNLVIQGSADIATLLSGVYLSLCPVRLFAGVRTVEQAKALFAVADSQQETPQLIELGATPLTSMVNGGATISLDDTIELAKQAAQRDNTRAILVDAVTFSNQGATDAEEIGLALAAGVEYLRALTDAGFTVEQALDQISFRFATTDEQFAQIAKFRAARQLWARVAEIVGAPEHGTCPQHALTAPVMFTQRDPWVNMLRSTVAAFAAGVGGATDVEVLPFDWAIPAASPATPTCFFSKNPTSATSSTPVAAPTSSKPSPPNSLTKPGKSSPASKPKAAYNKPSQPAPSQSCLTTHTRRNAKTSPGASRKSPPSTNSPTSPKHHCPLTCE